MIYHFELNATPLSLVLILLSTNCIVFSMVYLLKLLSQYICLKINFLECLLLFRSNNSLRRIRVSFWGLKLGLESAVVMLGLGIGKGAGQEWHHGSGGMVGGMRGLRIFFMCRN